MSIPYALLVTVSAVHPAFVAQETVAEERTVAAMVGDVPIHVRAVERELERTAKGRAIEPDMRPFLLAKTLQQLADRRLIVQWLRRQQKAASAQDIDLERARVERRVLQQGGTWDAYLEEREIDETELRDLLEWQFSWSRFLQQYLVAENLERFFDSHRRDFDGTRLRVAQILFRVASPADAQQIQVTLDTALQVRQRIEANEMTFAEAARKYSTAPSANAGGDIGFIERREPMPEVFSKAAFALQKNEVSAPVASPFGVHLIQCLEVEAGQRSWRDVQSELESAVIRHLFKWAADRGRKEVQIRFTGVTPYFRAGTEEVVEPGDR